MSWCPGKFFRQILLRCVWSMEPTQPRFWQSNPSTPAHFPSQCFLVSVVPCSCWKWTILWIAIVKASHLTWQLCWKAGFTLKGLSRWIVNGNVLCCWFRQKMCIAVTKKPLCFFRQVLILGKPERWGGWQLINWKCEGGFRDVVGDGGLQLFFCGCVEERRSVCELCGSLPLAGASQF